MSPDSDELLGQNLVDVRNEARRPENAELAVTVLEDGWVVKEPALILDSSMARKALELGEIDSIIRRALDAQDLSGNLVYVMEAE